MDEFFVRHVHLEIFLQRVVEGALAVVGGNGGVPVPALDVQEFLDDVRRVLSDDAKSVAHLVVKARITEGEHDVSGLLARALTVENEVLRNLRKIGIFCGPITHLLTSTHGG